MVICDLEAGISGVARAGQVDVVLVVAEPTVKSIDVARRAAGTSSADAQVIVVANRVRDEADAEAIKAELGGYEMVVVPEDQAIARADEEGRAPIDVDPDAPGVTALMRLAERLGHQPALA
jgi:CO dehydrogenase maturation factor